MRKSRLVNGRLAGEDSAWLHADTPDNRMVVVALLELDRRVPRAELERVLSDRLLRHERFRARVAESALRVGRGSWTPLPHVDLAAHVLHETLADAGEPTLRRRVGELASLPLPRDRPLWSLHLLDRPGAGTALLFRAHHAIGDGFALQAVLLSLCDDPEPGAFRAPLPSTRAFEEVRAALTRPWHVRAAARTSARCLRSLAHLMATPRDPPGILKGPLDTPKRVAWTRPLRLEEVRADAARMGGKVNDRVLAAVARALRAWLRAHGEPAPREIKALIPVNLRSPASALSRLGNYFGMVLLSIPVAGTATVERTVLDVKRRMDALKQSPEAVVGLGILQVFGRLPRWLERRGVLFFTGKASLVFSNVPGPTRPLRIAGARIRRLLFWVPQSGRVALGVSVISFAGDLVIGVMSDAGRIPDPQSIADAIEADLRSASAPPRARAPAAPSPVPVPPP